MITRHKISIALGDFWGGLAAMLVAFPAAIAFGVTVYAAISPAHAAYGALAGIIGVTVIGLVAATLGGTDRLISAPCAPAAAVLSAFSLDMSQRGDAPGLTVLLLIMVGVLAGVLQTALGLMRVGSLIRYIPYPVVSGYLTGVGLIIIGSQIPKFFGVADGIPWFQALVTPTLWDWRSLLIGTVTACVAISAPRLTRRIPGIILGIAAGIFVFMTLAAVDPELRALADNPLVIGSLAVAGDGFLTSLAGRWREIKSLGFGHLGVVAGTALTLAVLLSIDTLKTCVVLDKLTHSRHNSNRELIAQGVANIASNALGGISGAGQMGATLIGLNSGSSTRTAGILEGLFSLFAALILSSYISWIPVATLAGVLIVIGIRMIDRQPLRLIESRSTILDFCAVLAVVLVAIFIDLIAASGVGVGLAMILFVREQINVSALRFKLELSQTSSSWHRPERELVILEEKGNQAVIFELQGSLFFGNTYQLYADLEHEIRARSYVLIDLKRVQSIDVTAAQLFKQIRDTIKERGAILVLSGIRENHPSGRNLHEFLGQSGLWHAKSKTVRIFPELDAAITWVEDRLLGEEEFLVEDEVPMPLQEMEIFSGHKEETLSNLEAYMETRHYHAGETIYSRGDPGDELFWVRRGTVRLVASLEANKKKTVASFGRGDLFGSMAFMERKTRPHDAIAVAETEVYVLARDKFQQITDNHKRLAFNMVNAMAHTLSARLRHLERKYAMLQEY